jgi:vancomycin resistance protein YoaR
MKKLLLTCVMCFLFGLLSVNIGHTFAFNNENLEFYYNNKVFTYSLSNNIKTNNQFDIKLQLNKFDRFSNSEKRKKLLQHLLDIGISTEVAVNYLFPNLNLTIEKISKNIYVAPKNATLKINPLTEKVFYITPEIIGKELNKQLLYETICKNYLNNKELKIEVPITTSTPNICTKNFTPQINKRADFSTNIASSSSDRKHNIKNALNSLNKTIIMPNQVFSFNKTVGKRTEQNGYRTAKIIVNNEFVEGVGGGVCQVSSTLYNAALLSGLEIVEANKHSKQVGYVKYGFDAMVNFGSSDLKFKNTTSYPITIITNYSNDKIRIRIFGDHMNNTSYKLTNEITDVVEPAIETIIDTEKQYSDKVTYEDEYFYLKTATKGMKIKSYREKYVDNQFVSKELLRSDTYKVQNAIIVYGSTPREENINYSFSLTG